MFIAQASKYAHDFWRYLVGSFIIIVASVIGQLPFTFAVFYKKGFEIMGATEAELMQVLDSNLNLFLLLLSFVFGMLGIYLVVKFLHKQPFKTVTTTRQKVDWRRIAFGFTLIAIFTAVTTYWDYSSNPDNYVLNFEPVSFTILCIIAILMVPIQTSMEEYIFRGYLMQGFGLLAKNRWFPLLLTSFIFGGLHFFNPEVTKLGNIIMIYYIGTGLFLGIITLMDEGMELALGFHAGNNLIGVLLVTADWTAFQTESILKDVSNPTAGFQVILPVVIIYPIFLLIMAKVYKWKNWKEKLIGPVSIPDAEKVSVEEI
ncbi:CPBP family intramembrane glutamic endopeptidase [Mesonia mobilis]|uniref:CPBP family intramembrane glutamic endopeptidase n=1 Tax=Mesonia mobilis TaxID=369791 RepID=UPI0026ED0C10|nr:CPBP family intramembrane glutamic endopeptidase [Mesonia mobilis]|tara:strand:+ start:2072 stop:3016 length:945 start_codon:yes stop_codon:yes gene_type:complete